MEIRKIHFTAFGLFTDRTLNFAHESGGLHVVFGRNEAGKSSALRGLKALLYGIPERTTDNFIHSNENLRIEGQLKADGDRELTFLRRKGRKNTLMTPQGEVLAESVLDPFLSGVTLELFETLFGIDHAALVRGGREILERKGEVGELLFSAALGSPVLHTVLEQLDQDSEGLFKPRGSVQKINTAVRLYKEKNREMRECSLSSGRWNEHCRALSRITSDLERLREELTEKRRKLTHLERAKRVLPKLARRSELKRRLEECVDVVVLPTDFGQRREKAMQELEKAKAVDHQASLRLKKLQAELESVQVQKEVIREADAIDYLHELLGGHRKSVKDRPRLVAERRQLLVDMEALLREVRPGCSLDDAAELQTALNRRRRIAELGNQHQALVKGERDTDRKQKQVRKRLAEAKQTRRKLPKTDESDPLQLRRSISKSAKMGQLDEQLELKEKECLCLQEECLQRLARLPLWKGELQDVSSLPLPCRESIDRFDSEFSRLGTAEERLQEKRAKLSAELREAEKQLDEIQRLGTVPTEEDLKMSRFERDHAWQLLRRHWVAGEDVKVEADALDPDHELPDAFELRMAGSDDVADRLRREADRVHKKVSLLVSQEDLRHQLEEIMSQLDDLSEQSSVLQEEWRTLWKPCHLEPLTPREMVGWKNDLERLREKAEQLQTVRGEAGEILRRRDDHVRGLKQELKTLGRRVPDSVKSLQAVLSLTEGAAEELESLQKHREHLDKEIENLARDLETLSTEHQAARTELEEWKSSWQGVMEELGLGADALPSEANEILEKIRELFSKQSDAEKLRIRIEGLDRDAAHFETEVRRVAERVDSGQASLPMEQSVVRLNQLLAENLAAESRLQEIEKNQKQTESEIEEARTTIEATTASLSKLCMEAGCRDVDQLETAERKSDDFRRLKSEYESVEREILEAGEGASLGALEEEAQGLDPDTLSAEIDQLRHVIEEELEPRRTELAEMKGAEEKELSLMDGSDRAAELADESQGILAGIRRHVEQYLRLRLAVHILRQEIERYRRENEGPMVRRASEHFSVLTRGSFDSLRVDFSGKDEPVLVGIRPGGEVVRVEAMSSGSRDQLYLALRLAALEKYMETSEPLPFVVDDILVQFDDERSAATLKVLAEFGKTTQVILFTHHSRLVEQAKALKVETPVSVLEL